MISVTNLRNGAAFKLNGQLFQVLEYKHSKIGRGTANIRIKARNLETGNVVSKTFISGAKAEPFQTETRALQYLYQDDQDFYFMDPRSFEQFTLLERLLGEKAKFLKEGQEVKVLFGEEKPLSIDLATTLVFQVDQTSPGVKGDSANASFKPATLDNGLQVKVPLFIKKGDQVKIDTRTGEYLERV